MHMSCHLFGILSGPIALLVSSDDNALDTSCSLSVTKNSSGISVGVGCIKGVKWSVWLIKKPFTLSAKVYTHVIMKELVKPFMPDVLTWQFFCLSPSLCRVNSSNRCYLTMKVIGVCWSDRTLDLVSPKSTSLRVFPLLLNNLSHSRSQTPAVFSCHFVFFN